MNPAAIDTIDLVEELRLRRWARTNYVPADERDLDWHPIILDEMSLKDAELEELSVGPSTATFAPLGERLPGAHASHRAHGPRFLASPQRSSELHYT
jgi:hypothetical protein